MITINSSNSRYLRIIAVVVIFTFSKNIFSQSQVVEIKNVWIEEDIRYNNKMCLAIHCNFVVNQNKGNKIEIGALFKDSNGNWLTDINNKYGDSDGYVWVSSDGRCNYYDTEWKDYVLYIPNTEIHCRKGRNQITVVVYVYAKKKWYKSKICPTFTKLENEDYIRCPSCNGHGRRKCWNCNGIGYAQKMVQSKFPPYNFISTFGICDICTGKKNIECSQCYGSGMITKKSSQTYISPQSSGQYVPTTPNNKTNNEEVKRRTVKCTWCNGTGLILKYDGCRVMSFHDCVNVYCQQCATSHCKSNTIHQHCVSCDGTGERKQIFYDGKWIDKRFLKWQEDL